MKNQLDKLTTFRWEGINKRGIRVKGELSGLNQIHIHSELQRQGIEPLKIKKKPNQITLFRQKISANSIVLFTQHLATMISAGIPLVEALNTLIKAQAKTVAFQELIQSIKNDVAAGKTFSSALSQHPKTFNPLFCNLIRAGEISGTLDIMLRRLAEYLAKTASIKIKIRKAMYYPVTVISISLIISGLLLVFIVPQFENLFNSYGGKLPLFTRIIIQLSNITKNYWYIVLGTIFFGGYFLQYFRRKSHRFHYLIDKIMLKLPILNNLLQKTIIARMMRTLATTLTAGIPMIDALNCAASVANNKVYSQAIFQIRDDVTTGQQIHSAMSVTHIFPSMVVQMISVGEESGTISTMLDKIANFYEEEVNSIVNTLGTLMEPIIIIILSIIIGSFVLAMYLPIFKLGSVI